jgi:hypothetical protein
MRPALPTSFVLVLGLLVWPLAAQAQAAAPVDERGLSERVRSQASNPMRIILEASRIKRRPATDTEEAAPAVPPVTARTQVRAAEASAGAGAGASVLAPPRPQSLSLETLTPGMPPLVLPALPAVAEVPRLGALPGAAVAAGLATAAAGVAATTSAAAPLGEAAPRLLTMVAPELPPMLARRLGPLPDVLVEVCELLGVSAQQAIAVGDAAGRREPRGGALHPRGAQAVAFCAPARAADAAIDSGLQLKAKTLGAPGGLAYGSRAVPGVGSRPSRVSASVQALPQRSTSSARAMLSITEGGMARSRTAGLGW